MKTSTKRILSIGFSAFCLIAAFIVYGSLIRGELESASTRRGELISKENIFNNQKNAVSEVQKLISEFQSIATIQQNVSLAMPIGESTTDALNQWQAIVRSSGVVVRAFSLKPVALQPSKQLLAKRVGTLEMNTTVDGSYEQIKSFLRFLETNIRVSNVRSVSVSPVIGASSERYSLVLTVEMYYQEN